MKLYIAGCNGQVGWELVRQGPDYGFEILCGDIEDLDITKADDVKEFITLNSVSMVINAAAYTAVDNAETESEIAFAVNSDGAANIASACAESNIPMLHISTDYVFDGSKASPYIESDEVSPIGVYGKSKAEGDERIRNILKEHIIIRTAWVCGVHGNNFVKTMLRLGNEREEIGVVDDQHGCPTFAGDIAETLLKIADKIRLDKTVPWGTYHYCGNGETTWYKFAKAIFDIAGKYETLKIKKVVPITTKEYPTPAMRPENSVLDCSLIQENLGIKPKPWPESLKRMLKEIEAEGNKR
jgi:dTDP-4-dehydrorhamnose reductase